MAATTELERIAKLADFAETILDAVREYGFMVPPRPRRKPGRPPLSATNGVTPTNDKPKKRRGRPPKAKPIPPLPEQPSLLDVGSDADEIDAIE